MDSLPLGRNSLSQSSGQLPSTSAEADEPTREGSLPPPRKGILKRPSDHRKEKDTMFPLYRQSPDRFPEKGMTKIPKLNVTWFEKNAINVYGDTSDENNTDSEQHRMYHTPITIQGINIQQQPETAILDDYGEDEEGGNEEIFMDGASVTSSTGSAASSVVGRWWIAKDTRFVPHCQKRGCNHNHEELREYLTPTQRKNKEMAELKKELRKAIEDKDEKEKHLMDLRERIEEIEKVTEEGQLMNENHKLLLSKREMEKTFEIEKKGMEKRHVIRVNQLIQETMQAREEVARLTLQLHDLEDKEKEREAKEYNDGSTQTEMNDPLYAQTIYQTPISIGPLGEIVTSPVMSTPTSPLSLDPFTLQQYVGRETANQLQAYRNEAVVWRSKAAQLELIVRDHLIKTNEQENNLINELERMRRECERLREMLREREEGMGDSGIENPLPSSPQRRIAHELEIPPPPPEMPGYGPPPGECLSSSCTERKKNLLSENKRLVDNMEELNGRTSLLEEELNGMKEEIERMQRERIKMMQDIGDAQRTIEQKTAQVSAGNIVISRIQGEKETLAKAVTYLEERMQVYQHTILDNDLVVEDENSSEWRRGFNDPRYKVCVSKRIQTVLTSEELTEHEDEFKNIQKKLKILDEEFSAKRADLHDRFGEVEANLAAKANLVETLSRQLANAQKEAKKQMDEHQKERDEHAEALQRVMNVAERVPVLQMRIEELTHQRAELEVRIQRAKEEYEKGLEEALKETLNKYQQQSRYWKDKMGTMEKQINSAKNETVQLQREREETKLKWRVEKADLESRLTSSIGHVENLREKIHRPSRDVQCEAKPKHVSKYVACRPHTKTRTTEIEKGDLLNEEEERIRTVQSELTNTKRQMHVLQQKLIDCINEKKEQRFKIRTRVASTDSLLSVGEERKLDTRSVSPRVEREENQRDKNDQLEEMKEENKALKLKLMASEGEKNEALRGEKDRIQTLVTEFDSLRGELDQEMRRYEAEKKWLKQRISNLEESNKELQKTVEGMRTMEKEASERRMRERKGEERIRKTLSEPRIIPDAEDTEEELQRLRREKNIYSRELQRVRDCLQRVSTVDTAKGVSPSFKELVSDLNTAKDDLERVLVTMDRDAQNTVSEEATVTILPSTSSVSATEPRTQRQSPETILDIVMTDWKNDQVEKLANELRRSRQERESLRLRLDTMTKEMREATTELELYRREGRCMSPDGLPLKRTSRSTVDLTRENVDLEECLRWKEKAGTMFRELTRMRSGYKDSLNDRRDLRVQLAILRGELELARCQLAENERGRKSCIAHGRSSIRSRMERPPLPEKRENEHSSRERPPKDPFIKERAPSEELRVQRVSAWIKEPKEGRTRSEERRRRSKSGGRRRRKEEKDSSPFSFVQESRGSMPSIPFGGRTNNFGLLGMSQSWHNDANSEESETSMRRQSRMVSLREKVTRMNKENKELKEKIENLEKEETIRPDEEWKMFKEIERLKKELRERRKNEPTVQLIVDASKIERDQLRDENERLNKELEIEKRKEGRIVQSNNEDIMKEMKKMREENQILKEIAERTMNRRSESFAAASLCIPSMSRSYHVDTLPSSLHPSLSTTSSSIFSPSSSRPVSAPEWNDEQRLREDNTTLALVLTQENTRLKNALDRMTRQVKTIGSEGSNERMKESNQKLKSAIEQLKVDQKETEEKEKETRKLKEENEELKGILEKYKEEKKKMEELLMEGEDIKDRLRMTSMQNEVYEKKLREVEEERKEMYLVMFKKGQEAAAMGMKEDDKVDIITEDRIILKFLHDAFYYFLLNKGDSKEHLQAIMTMLNFTAQQRDNVTRKRGQ